MATDFVPEVFGRLTTLDDGHFIYYGAHNQNRCKWHKVRCVCGTEKAVRRCCLVSGNTKSCGCLRLESVRTMHVTHGQSGLNQTPEYRAYNHMLTRCYNPNSEHYADYGGRGIGVWDTWRGPGGFELWFAEIGQRPSSKHSVDRFPNPDGNYEPGNVRWATKKEQANNTRRNVHLTHNGKTQTVSQWSEELGINDKVLYWRTEAGWSAEKTLTQPLRKQKPRKTKEKLSVRLPCRLCV